ncbi:MAG: hypothetical protein ACFCUH_10775 [Flavobacteriales bacterium]
MSVALWSCGNISDEVECKLQQLENKTKSLDSLVNTEINKVQSLDSLIEQESAKVKQLDTLLNKASTQLDSLSKKGGKLFENITK